MQRVRFVAFTAFAILFSAAVVDADNDEPTKSLPVRILKPNEATRIEVENVSCEFPFHLPSSERILAERPKGKDQPKPESIRAELVWLELDTPKHYPVVGPAQLCKCHFRCTLTTSGVEETFELSHSQLRLVNVPAAKK